MMETDWNQRYLTANTPWDSGVPSQELEYLVEDKLVRPCPMLELGCGTGTNAIFLARRGFDVTAIDISPEALRQAREKAEKAGLNVNFIETDVTGVVSTADIAGAPFQFVFDRGTYHVVREKNLEGFQRTLSRVVAVGGLYVVLIGNANEVGSDEGPPRVRAHSLCEELEGRDFDLVRLREIQFHGVRIDGRSIEPLAWSAVFRRRGKARD